jgi:hypothetical protein
VTVVDRQLREGASHWCFEKTKEGMSVTVNFDFTDELIEPARRNPVA